MTATPVPAPGSPEVFEALKRVKGTEADGERRVAEARAASTAELARAHEAADAAIARAARDAEAERAEAVARADREAQAEAREIVGAGEEEARRVRADEGSLAAGLRKEILGVVLGGFAGD